MKISEHFNREEFTCSCGCEFNTVDAELLRVLEQVRTHYDQPVTINSACRCLEHNRAIGSTDTSQHVNGKAADIKIKSVSSIGIYHYLNNLYPDCFGIGIYDSFLHIDVRDDKGRWDNRT
jgi:uncharacterized protein YcbK (DUF882 family)